jgi:cytochrome b6-f complex iron-sulfur subunit
MAEEKKRSVADILAAARNADGGKSDDAPAEEAAQKPVADQAAPAETPAAAPVKKLKPGEKPSVADILAMARAGDKPGADSPDPPAEDKPKLAAKKPGKPAAKATPAKSEPAERLTTASILAAARTDTKRGPMTKAEAAEKQPDTSEAKAKPKAPAGPKPAMPTMPEKPVYAKPTNAVPKPDQGRRSILAGILFANPLATGMTALATAITLWCLALARFMFPNILTEPPSQFKIGFPADFAPGFVVTKFKAQFGIWVANYEYNGRQQIYALSTVCTHLGCTPNWLEAEQKFKCPCHGSGFYKSGINFEGPAPRPLERYAIKLADDGQLEVDKSRKFQEEIGQWEDAASYVPV